MKEKLLTFSPKQMDDIGNGSTDDLIINLIKVISGMLEMPLESVKGPFKSDDGSRLFIIRKGNPKILGIEIEADDSTPRDIVAMRDATSKGIKVLAKNIGTVPSQWISTAESNQLPPERRLVLLSYSATKTLPSCIVVGYLRQYSDNQGHYWVTPGADIDHQARQVTHWSDCLGDGFHSPNWDNKTMNNKKDGGRP
jgi:hypothetical protein